eukprot:gene5068-2154_t
MPSWQARVTQGGRVTEIRTSHGAWLDDSIPAARIVRDRIQKVTGFPRANFEQMQVLRYYTGQKYVSHFDFFNPSGYGKQNWNRAITCFLALSTVDRGGETTFPQAGGAIGVPGDENGCSTGLQVKQVKGAAVLFYDMRQDYNLDPFSRHGGCP